LDTFLKKIQGLPERKRKIIFWLLIVIISLSLVFFYIKNVQKKLKTFKIEESKKEIPKSEIPEIKIPIIGEGEDLEKLKEQPEKLKEKPLQ